MRGTTSTENSRLSHRLWMIFAIARTAYMVDYSVGILISSGIPVIGASGKSEERHAPATDRPKRFHG